MTIQPYPTVWTKKGTCVHLITSNDLYRSKKTGSELRCCCPIHGSSSNDDLSVVLPGMGRENAGWGRCYGSNCLAVVLVVDWAPEAAENLLKAQTRRSQSGGSLLADMIEHAKKNPVTFEAKATPHQASELAELDAIASVAVSRLDHPRAQAYLASRGLGSALLTRLGVGYIPDASEWRQKPPFALLRWCDRLVFPTLCKDGSTGYIGRSLKLWEEGMDENEHKRLINEHDKAILALPDDEHWKQVRRWLKTWKDGYFNGAVLHKNTSIYLCEGAFDALALMLIGLDNVTSLASTHIDITAIPQSVKHITLALDLDQAGKPAISNAVDRLEMEGFTVEVRLPVDDGQGKDWSERYRVGGDAGLACLFPPVVVEEVALPHPEQAMPPLAVAHDAGSVPDAQPLTCSICDYPDEALHEYEVDGCVVLVCPLCREGLLNPLLCALCQEQGATTLAVDTDPDTLDPICADHKPKKIPETLMDIEIGHRTVIAEAINLFGAKYSFHALDTDFVALSRVEAEAKALAMREHGLAKKGRGLKTSRVT